MKRENEPETENFYDSNAADFVERTQNVDMSPLYGRFFPLIPQAGRILDAGCGSGRDSKVFLDCGYDVVSMDVSKAMVEATTRLTGRPALKMAFRELEFDSEFDAIWASASLLHVPRRNLTTVLGCLAKALRPDGVLYMSFKYGESERLEGGRFFNDYTDESIVPAVEIPQLRTESVWLTEDARPDRDEKWVNVLARRVTALGIH